MTETDRKLFAALKIEPCDLDDVEIEATAPDLAASLATSERFIRDVMEPAQAEEYFHPETLDDAIDLIETYRRSDHALRATIRQLIADSDPLHVACERWIRTAQRSHELVVCQWWMIAALVTAMLWLAWETMSR